MTIEFMFLKNLWKGIKFINKYGIPITNIMLKLMSPYLEPSLEPTVISLNFSYWKAR